VTILIVIAATALALLGTPLFVLIGLAGLAGFHFSGQEIAILIGEITRLAQTPALSALPLFTLAGFLMAESKAPERLVDVAQSLFGWMPGGLAIVSLATCAVFTALTGASGVTIIALGGLLLPALLKETYPEKFSLGLLVSGGSLGLLFPPSLPLILYGLVASVSVDELFIAGLVPGLVIVALLSVYSALVGHNLNIPLHKFDRRRVGRALVNARWELPIPGIILGGIYGGFVTASEAAAVTAMYVLVVEVVLYKDIRIRELPRIGLESMSLIGAILLILGVALGFTNYLVDQRIPYLALEWMQQYIRSPIGFLLFLNVFLLVVGCLMDVFSALVVVVPLILPIAREFGVDPIHLGIIFLTNLEIGFSTPPVGMNLFLASFRFERPITTLYAAVLPWLGVRLVALLLVTYIPVLSLWWR
jgi:tripartite ATP-independent transporter DctM subunit